MRLVESPRERLREVTIGMATDPALSHVLLGAFLTSLLQYGVGTVPWPLPAVSGLLWLLAALLYAVLDEIVQRIEEERNRRLEPESEFYGIE